MYRYYEGGVSSVFLWDLDDGGFAGVVLFKKSMYLYSLHFSIALANPVLLDTRYHSTDPTIPWGAVGFLGLYPRFRGRRARSASTLQAHFHSHAPDGRPIGLD